MKTHCVLYFDDERSVAVAFDQVPGGPGVMTAHAISIDWNTSSEEIYASILECLNQSNIMSADSFDKREKEEGQKILQSVFKTLEVTSWKALIERYKNLGLSYDTESHVFTFSPTYRSEGSYFPFTNEETSFTDDPETFSDALKRAMANCA